VSILPTTAQHPQAHISQGDTSGFGLHADFANGWNITLLQNAINDPTCNSAEGGIEKCQTFSRWNGTQIPPCMPAGMYPNEPVGLDNRPLTALPGCKHIIPMPQTEVAQHANEFPGNALWTDNSTKPTTCATTVTPSLDLQLGPDLTEFNFVSCAFDQKASGAMLTEFVLWDIENVDTCLSTCSNYTYAAVS